MRSSSVQLLSERLLLYSHLIRSGKSMHVNIYCTLFIQIKRLRLNSLFQERLGQEGNIKLQQIWIICSNRSWQKWHQKQPHWPREQLYFHIITSSDNFRSFCRLFQAFFLIPFSRDKHTSTYCCFYAYGHTQTHTNMNEKEITQAEMSGFFVHVSVFLVMNHDLDLHRKKHRSEMAFGYQKVKGSW